MSRNAGNLPVSQHGRASTKELRRIDFAELQFLDLSRERQGTDLEESEVLGGVVAFQIHGELELDRPLRAVLPDLQQQIENLGQGKPPVLENRCEIDEAHARPRKPVIDGVVFGRVGRTDRGERSILLRRFKSQLNQLDPAVAVEVQAPILELQSVKIALRVLENVLDRRELDQVARVLGTKADASFPFTNRFSQPERNGCDPVFARHRSGGIKIVGPRDTGKIRIEPVPVDRSHQFLHDDRHLFFFQAVGRGPSDRPWREPKTWMRKRA